MNRSNILRFAHLSGYLHQQYIDANDTGYAAQLSTYNNNISDALHMHVLNKQSDISVNPSTTPGISREEAEYYTLLHVLPMEHAPSLQ